MVEFTQESGKIIRCMAEGYSHGGMEEDTKENM